MAPTQLIDEQISKLTDWRGKLYAELRKIIHEAFPEIVEDFKWGTGVFAHNGNVCAVGTFNDHVKINFFQGALIVDPHKLFNAGLEAKKSRSIDLFEKDKVNEVFLKELVTTAVNFNDKK